MLKGTCGLKFLKNELKGHNILAVNNTTVAERYKQGSYQFLVHHVAPVDGGRAFSADQVVNIVEILS